MNHDAILESVWWALSSVTMWTSNKTRRVDRFSVAMYGKGAQIGCEYTEGEMVMITAKQVMQVCRYDLSHSYDIIVNVRHTLYKRGLGAPMGGMLSAFYAILRRSRREATAFTPRLRELALPCQAVAVCRYMDDVYIAIAYAENDQLVQATQVVHFIAAAGTGYPPPLVLTLEPEGPQRFLEMTLSIECVGTAIVVSFFNKAADDWVKTGSTVQVRLPSSYSYVSGHTQQARVRGTIRRMLECGLRPQEMARAITELQYEVALSGYRHPHASSALRHLMTRPSCSKERKVIMMEVWERVKHNGF